MTSWSSATLGEIAHITIGKTPPRKEPRYWTTDLRYPFCSIADMKGRIVDPSSEGVTDAAIAEGKAKRFPAGSLMMSFKLSIGRVGFAARDLYPNEAIARFETDPNKVDEAFLALALEDQDLTRGAGRAVKGSTLNSESLRAIRIDYPDVAGQRRIVAVASVLDAHGTALRRELASARTLLQTERALLTSAYDSTTLNSVIDVARSGGTPNRSNAGFYGGQIPWLKSGEVNSPAISATEESITEAALGASSAWLVPKGTTVVAMYGATAAQVGFLAESMATNQAVLALRAKRELALDRFLYHWLWARSAHLKSMASGAAQPNLSKGIILQEAGFPVLSLDEQRAWIGHLDALTDVVETLTQEADRAEELRSSLISGMLAQRLQAPISLEGWSR